VRSNPEIYFYIEFIMTTKNVKLPSYLKKFSNPKSGFSIQKMKKLNDNEKCDSYKLETYYGCCNIKILTYDVNRTPDADISARHSMIRYLYRINELTYDPSGNNNKTMKRGGKIIELSYFWNNRYSNDDFNPVLKKYNTGHRYNRGKENRDDIMKGDDLKGNWKDNSYIDKKVQKGRATQYLQSYIDIMIREGLIDVENDYIGLMTRYIYNENGYELVKFYEKLGFVNNDLVYDDGVNYTKRKKGNIRMGCRFSVFWKQLKQRNVYNKVIKRLPKVDYELYIEEQKIKKGQSKTKKHKNLIQEQQELLEQREELQIF